MPKEIVHFPKTENFKDGQMFFLIGVKRRKGWYALLSVFEKRALKYSEVLRDHLEECLLQLWKDTGIDFKPRPKPKQSEYVVTSQ